MSAEPTDVLFKRFFRSIPLLHPLSGNNTDYPVYFQNLPQLKVLAEVDFAYHFIVGKVFGGSRL